MHEVKYYDFGETTDIKKEVAKMVDKLNKGVGNGYDYWQGLQRIGDKTFKNYDDACKFLDGAEDYVVPYYETKYKPNEKLKKFTEKKKRLDEIKSNIISKKKVKYSKIGNAICPVCNSRINPKYQKGNKCIVCGGDMVPTASTEREKKIDMKLKAVDMTIKELSKQAELKTGKIRWLGVIDKHS